MALDFYEDDDGDKWVSCDACLVGDYGGAGSVGEANIRALERDYPDCHWVRYWPYSARQLYLTHTPKHEELMRGLDEDYPLYDEEEHSRVESDWEEEAWKDWLRSDLLRILPDGLKEWAEDLEDEQLRKWYREAMEEENEYPTAEYSGVYVEVDRIKDTFQREVEAECVSQCWEIANRLQLDVRIPFLILADRIEEDGDGLLANALRDCEEEDHGSECESEGTTPTGPPPG